MAHLRCDFFSDALGLSTSMTVILPQASGNQIGIESVAQATEPPVLYLLHGLSDDDTIWLRHTSIERYAAQRGLAVVMPQVHRSFYADEAYGMKFWTFLSEELPAVVGRFFRVSERREDSYVAGLSMGGYGAFKWALRRPGRFAAAASLSGVLDLDRRVREDDTGLFRPVFGDRPVAGSDDDLLALLGRAGADLPRLYVACGTEDVLYADNRSFVAACAAAGIAVTTDFGPGEHEWGYWDARIQNVLTWMFPPQP
ncbi:alpha/beta hydrolase [Hamadaea tsunoensis]|uniref:alpha/beta hydrolase n=1 Tax=Hamadaea tsunoensis TaxID=53368 RepID=UPI00040490B0|nr:alpha/beta hydrolase family protein [Hamadaea tsunoensis]